MRPIAVGTLVGLARSVLPLSAQLVVDGTTVTLANVTNSILRIH